MGAVWRLEEARLVQNRTSVSAANADSIGMAAVPAGKVWCVLACSYYPSATETQVVSFQKVWPGIGVYGLLNPVSMALIGAGAGAVATPIEQGMELFLLPGEYIQATRATHTAGSTMTINIQFVEIDMPLYTYDEPQEVKRNQRGISSIMRRVAGTSRGSTGPGFHPTTPGGGGGGTPPAT